MLFSGFKGAIKNTRQEWLTIRRARLHPGKRCKFGWVKRTKPFGVKEFVAEYPEIERNEEQYNLLADLLSAIANLPEHTPVAGSYFVEASSSLASS